MEDELKNLKKTLDQGAYKGTHFTEKHKDKVFHKIHSRSGPKPNRWMPYLSFAVCAALILFVVQFAWGQVAKNNAKNTVHQASLLKGHDPISILFVRTETKRQLPVSMALMSVDVEDDSAVVVNLPRDLNMGKESPVKLGNVYRTEKPQAFRNSVENFLGVPVDFSFSIDNNTFARVVDAVGGITVINPTAFGVNSYHFSSGEIQLDGKEALAYTSMDFEGILKPGNYLKRQQWVMEAVAEKIFNLSTITKLKEVLTILESGSQTNMSLSEMVAFYKNHNQVFNHVEVLHLDGSPKRIKGIYYFKVSEEEKQRVSNQLRGQ